MGVNAFTATQSYRAVQGEELASSGTQVGELLRYARRVSRTYQRTKKNKLYVAKATAQSKHTPTDYELKDIGDNLHRLFTGILI